MDSAAARPDEEEARHRRSTDCIYFLASPLTCKKGSECEYRHSDAARMNPRDCWYWFHGNCANPKCSFRHPPLDNLAAGAPTTTPRPPQLPVPQASAPVPAQHHGSKQAVPCYYFQKGMCTKGDRCTFLHAPGNPAPQPPPKVFTFAPALQPNLNNSWTKPNSSSQQSAPAVGLVDKPKASAHDGKPLHHKQSLTSRADHPPRAYQNHTSSYAQPGAPKRYQPQPPVQDGLTDSGMEAGEFVREPSAGSGLIVGGADDSVQQSFKGNHTAYNHRANGTGGMTRQTHGGYESERSYRNSTSEKRIPQREHIPAVAAGSSDLRHRLKQRKLNNNSGSTQVPGRHDTHLEVERSDQHRRRGEQQDGLSRSRLRDRIKLPGETSFDRLGSRSEEWDRGSRARLSPPKPLDLRGRLHERLKARSAEEIPGNSSARDLAAKENSSEDTESLNFAGPKSLAELKAKKGVGRSGEDAIVKGLGSSRVTSEIVSSREPAPFEGPKPLSAILKRKREAASEIPAAEPGIIQEADNYAAGAEEEFQTVANDTVGENMEGIGEEEEEEEAFRPEYDVAYDDDANEGAAVQELDEYQDVEAAAEDNADEAAVAQELDEYQDAEAAAEEYDDEAAAAQEVEEHQDGEAAAEEYDDYAEEENEYQEYQDDDDDLEDEDDDFARKVSVMIS